jgi:Spy/CpxP family protein refolding chaperone
MKKKGSVLTWLLILLCGGTLFFNGSHAFAKEGREHGIMRSERWSKLKGVSLDPEQKAKVKEFKKKVDDEMVQMNKNLLNKSKELRSLWADPKADSEAILKKDKEMRALRDQMADMDIEFKLEVRKILTPEQISKWGGSHHKKGHGLFGLFK